LGPSVTGSSIIATVPKCWMLKGGPFIPATVTAEVFSPVNVNVEEYIGLVWFEFLEGVGHIEDDQCEDEEK